MRLTISDDLADRYLAALPINSTHQGRKIDPDSPQHTLEALLLIVLERAVPLAYPGSLALSVEQTDALVDALLLPAGAREVDRIVAAAQELVDMKIGRFRLKLPPAVLRGLQERSEREGKPMAVYMQQVIDKVTEEMAQYA